LSDIGGTIWEGAYLIRTDHFSLKFLLDQRLSTTPQHQWHSKLVGFNFWVEFKPGATNVVADALSRRDAEETGEVMALIAPTFQLFNNLTMVLVVEPVLRQLCDKVQTGDHDNTWKIPDGLITVVGRVYMPPSSPNLPAILDVAHDVGHEGV
jgi:hypothetical protein